MTSAVKVVAEQNAVVQAYRDDRFLLTRVAVGDKEAFEKLFVAYHGAVSALVVSVLRDRAQAQEVTQEVFLQVWQQAARFDPTLSSTGAWMKQLARRRAIDRVRSCESAGARDTGYAAMSVAVDADVVVEQVLQRESHALLQAALQRLRPLQRESIVLAYYAGMSTAEIAVSVGRQPRHRQNPDPRWLAQTHRRPERPAHSTNFLRLPARTW